MVSCVVLTLLSTACEDGKEAVAEFDEEASPENLWKRRFPFSLKERRMICYRGMVLLNLSKEKPTISSSLILDDLCTERISAV